MPNKKSDYDNYRISSNFAECPSGLGVTACLGLQQMETELKIIDRILQEVGLAQCRPIGLPTNKTDGAIHIMES